SRRGSRVSSRGPVRCPVRTPPHQKLADRSGATVLRLELRGLYASVHKSGPWVASHCNRSEYIRLARSLYGASGPSLSAPDTRAKLFMRPVVSSFGPFGACSRVLPSTLAKRGHLATSALSRPTEKRTRSDRGPSTRRPPRRPLAQDDRSLAEY